MTAGLDWVSPLRPKPTDIAEYSARVAKALSSHLPINLIDDESAENLTLYQFAAGPFFNIGNDARFHGGVLRACRAMSGIIVAHDLRIQNLIVAELQANHKDWASRYAALMHRHYGEDGLAAARGFISGERKLDEISQTFPGIEIAAENSLCMITHNPSLTEELARRTGLYSVLLPLPFAVPEQMPPRQRKPRAEGIDLLVFGYIGFNRCLETLCELVRERRGLRLNLAGRIGPEALQRQVDKMKAEGYPIVDHGFVDEDRLDQLVRDSDLVLNLRNPSMGEVSGSQLRIFANGGLSVVCDTGWYSSLPENAVLKVRPEALKSELTAILERVESDPDRHDRMRVEGFAYVKRHHDLDRFAEVFLAFMAASDEAFAHGRRLQLARHIGGLYLKSGAGAMLSGEKLVTKAAELLGGPAL